jgi:hypothetical protein
MNRIFLEKGETFFEIPLSIESGRYRSLLLSFMGDCEEMMGEIHDNQQLRLNSLTKLVRTYNDCGKKISKSKK